MKTKGRVLAAAVVIAFTVGTAGSSFAFGGWPYPGHWMRPDLEEQQKAVAAAADKAMVPKKNEGAVKEGPGTKSSTEKAPEAKPAPDAPAEK